MSEQRAYFPLFPSMDKITEELTDEDLGIVIRAVMRGVPTDKRPEGYTVLQFMAYKMMVDSADRVWNSPRKKNSSYGYGQNKKPVYDKYGSDEIDPEEALRLALERTFGDDDDDEG